MFISPPQVSMFKGLSPETLVAFCILKYVNFSLQVHKLQITLRALPPPLSLSQHMHMYIHIHVCLLFLILFYLFGSLSQPTLTDPIGFLRKVG